MNLTRTSTLAVLLIAATCAHASDTRPNVVLFMTDDQGFGDLGVQGNEHVRTPNLDRFASQGVELTRFYCSPVCAPTRASLMTGRYYYRSGVVHTSRGGAKMHGDEVTIAERLQKAGYTTGIFGKWHLGDTYPMRPQDQGFDESLVHKSGGIDQTPDRPNSYFDPVLWHNGRRVKTDGYCTDVFTDAAIRFVKTNRDRPFFLYLPTNAPHTPLEVAPEYSEPYRRMGLNETTAKVYGMVENIDDNFGRLMATLDTLGLRENTLVIFFGDNGPQQSRYNAGLRGRKASAYEGGIRVGAYFQWPAAIEGGRKLDTIAAHIDIGPTLLAAAGVAEAGGPTFDGVNLLPLLQRDATDWPDRTLYFQCHRGLVPQPFQNCAAVTQRYKLIGYPGTFSREDLDTSGPPLLELYDIASDPGEATDLADERPEELARLRAGYEAWFADVERTRHFAPGVIHLGSDAAKSVLLCRYQDGSYVDGVSQGWSVEVKTTGRYELTINRSPLIGPGRLFVSWQGKEMSQPVAPDAASAVFDLTAGRGMLDIWFVEDGKQRVVFSDNGTTGDVIARILD